MIQGIDFTKSKINKLRMYGGANGNKIGIYYNDDLYMLKFPPKPTKNLLMSYTNSCISEHVACQIFETLGLDVQKTLLGTYGDKIVVACKDFETEGFLLKEFAHLKNTIIESEQDGYGTELKDILKTIESQQIIPSIKLREYFWEMFIGDALLGNFDRHNGNWGFLVNDALGVAKLAPIFDCGSCLYPQLDENKMLYVLSNRKEIDERIFVFPNSAIREDGRKINYVKFLTKTKDKDCIKALKKVSSMLDVKKINLIIESTPYISNKYKIFLKTIIKERKAAIIDKALERDLSLKIKKKNREMSL